MVGRGLPDMPTACITLLDAHRYGGMLSVGNPDLGDCADLDYLMYETDTRSVRNCWELLQFELMMAASLASEEALDE